MEVNAVFEGGGIKGISLAGAVYAAERRGIVFRHLGGTSVGAVISALLAAGYGADDLRRIIEATPFRSFLRRSPVFNVRVVGPAARLMWKKGLFSGEALENWMRGLLANRGIRTFADLPKRKLRIVASDITNGRLLVLPDDLVSYGVDERRFEVAKAVRMSASIPYFFDPVLIRQRGGDIRSASFRDRFAYIVDGALLSNFPMWLFDREETSRGGSVPTLGFRMVGKNDNEPRIIRGPFTMFQAMFETMMQAHDERYIEKQERDRTIKIPTLGVRSTQFDLSDELSRRLFDSGRDAAESFFQTFRRGQ